VTPKPPDVEAVLAWLQRRGSPAVRNGMARYGIPSDKAFGISVGDLRRYAKELGRDHRLAAALWKAGWYEARMLATFIDEPARVSAAQMERWCRQFDSWAICDTACFSLFDQTPHAWDKLRHWAEREDEFVKRAAFARADRVFRRAAADGARLPCSRARRERRRAGPETESRSGPGVTGHRARASASSSDAERAWSARVPAS
jgi:hypothetical protein